MLAISECARSRTFDTVTSKHNCCCFWVPTYKPCIFRAHFVCRINEREGEGEEEGEGERDEYNVYVTTYICVRGRAGQSAARMRHETIKQQIFDSLTGCWRRRNFAVLRTTIQCLLCFLQIFFFNSFPSSNYNFANACRLVCIWFYLGVSD